MGIICTIIALSTKSRQLVIAPNSQAQTAQNVEVDVRREIRVAFNLVLLLQAEDASEVKAARSLDWRNIL
jgi:hypothetical protein